MPMRLDSPRLTGPPTTRKREQSAVQAECAPINLKGSSTCKFFSFDHFSSQCSWISSSCSTDCKFIENRRPFYCICHDDEELKVRNTSDLEAPSEFHTHDVVQKPDEKVSQFSTENPYSCCMPALRQRYHPYRRINWGTKRRKILFRKPAANTNNFITGYDTNSLVDASADAGSKFLGLPFNNVLAYTAFIHDDNDDDDEDAVNGDQGKRQYFKKQRSYDTREKGNQQTEIQNEIERSSIDNDLPETTTCIVVPGGYLFDAFKSTKIIASETSDESFFHETDVRDDNFSRIKNKSKKTPLRSHRCCKDKYSSADDFRNDKRDYLYESKRRSRNEKKPHTARYSKSSIYGCLQSELSLFKDTNPIYFPKSRKARNSVEGWSKSYTLFFILYLLALPLLCSTNPSPQVPSALAQKSPLSRNEDYTQRNVSSTAQQYTPSNNGQQQHLRQGQQVVQERQIVHPYNEYSWEVNQINPWLSACDLAGPAPADLQGSCGPPEVPKYCPLPCAPKSPGDSNVAFREVIERYEIVSGKIKGRKSRSWSGLKRSPGEDVLEEEKEDNSKRGADRGGRKSRADTSPGKRTAPEQCLFYLEESHKRDICRDDFGQGSPLSFLTPRENRYWFTSGLRLRHCCEHAVVNALTPGKDGPLEDVLNGGRKCVDALDKLLLVDALAARLHCEFEEVLARYDCGQSYSVIHNCTHCKEAYRKWVCSSLVPYFAHGGPLDLETRQVSWAGKRLRPCRSFCQSVEQRCPYLLPGDRAPAYPTQYAGEPTFLCQDPNIPETGEQAMRALHGDERKECCFRVCSEDEPGLGICANCTDQKPHGSATSYDPPTAPQCETSSIPTPFGTTGQEQQLGVTSDPSSSYSSTPLDQQPQQPQSFCGSGGVGTMISSSSPNTAPPSIPILCLFWVWGALISACTGQTTIPWCLVLEIFIEALSSSLESRQRPRCPSRTSERIAYPTKIAIQGAKCAYLAIYRLSIVVKCWCRWWWYWWWWSWRWKSVDRCLRLSQVMSFHSRKPRCQRCPRRNCEFGWQPRRRRRRKRRKKRFCASCHHIGFDLDRSTYWSNPS